MPVHGTGLGIGGELRITRAVRLSVGRQRHAPFRMKPNFYRKEELNYAEYYWSY